MLRVVAGVLVAGLIPLLVTSFIGGCSSTSASFATGCTTYTPDAGTSSQVGCAIGWSCNSGDALYEMICTEDSYPEYYRCACSNGVTTSQRIRVDTFICTAEGALSTANMGCEFNIQM